MNGRPFPIDCKVQIHRDFLHHRIVVICYDDSGYYTIKDDALYRNACEPGAEITPLFACRETGFLQAFADALGEFGIAPKTTSHAGELKATQLHLADMQEMAKSAFSMMTTVRVLEMPKDLK